MSATNAISYSPTFSLCSSTRFPIIKPLKPNRSLQFPRSNSVSLDGLFSRKTCSNTVTELIKTSTFRSNDSDNGIKVSEQEALIHGSTELMAQGFESSLNRLSKWIVAGLLGAVVVLRHDPEGLWAFKGAVCNTILSVALKRIINQERPIPTLRTDPGMPSSHSQYIFFVFVFSILSMVELLGLNAITLTFSGLALMLASYLSWLRVSQQLHTISQVAVGAVVGSIFATLWYLSWTALIVQAFNSHLWVRMVVVSGTAGFCLVLYMLRDWFYND